MKTLQQFKEELITRSILNQFHAEVEEMEEELEADKNFEEADYV